MAILKVDAYPCAWPADWPRTEQWKRQNSRYRTAFGAARDDVVRQLHLLHASEIIVSSNIPLRRDGLPYASATEPRDPAVAVYWVVKNTPRVIACDQWSGVRDNLRAVGLALSAMRQIQRTGVTQVIERVYQGFQVLAASNPQRTWREVFDKPLGWKPAYEEIVARYRELLLTRHPDHGGSHEDSVELNRAFKEACDECKR
jgi:hypothetical protein